MDDQLKEADDLAIAIVLRLEAGEAVCAVALASRRLANMLGDTVNAVWLDAEIAGLDGPQPDDSDHLQGQRIFFRLRASSAVKSVAEALKYLDRGEPFPRGEVIPAPLAVLEGIAAQPPSTVGAANSRQADLMFRQVMTVSDAARILVLVREHLHQWASSTRTRVHAKRRLSELLGPDAVTVFSAGGSLLDELSKAVDNLRPGMQATAAMQARTALMTLGRELYKGGPVHTSPRTGEVHQVKSEKNALFAFLDGLWSRADTDHRLMIEKAIAVVDEAYDLGSKAKNPIAITAEEAQVVVRHVYTIARAICFSGGFPPRTDGETSV